MSMQQLIYCSRPFGYQESTLAGILATSRPRNARENITGALICRHDMFCQLLEGPEGNVESCLERILRDDRHVEVEVLLRVPVDKRMFGDWSMFHDPQFIPQLPSDANAADALRQAPAEEVRRIFSDLSVAAVS
jgi:hypothetical protein